MLDWGMNIDQICNKYNFVLVDTCALISCFRHKSNYYDKKNKLEFSNQDNELLDFWAENIQKYPSIHVTPKIIGEIDCEYKFTKTVKHCSGKYNDRTVLELRRSLQKGKQKRMRLINTLEEENRIISLNCDTKLRRGYVFGKYLPFMQQGKISTPDLDLLATGVALAYNRNACIISNDFNLIDIGSRIAHKFFLPKDKFNLYFNKGYDYFEEAFAKKVVQ